MLIVSRLPGSLVALVLGRISLVLAAIAAVRLITGILPPAEVGRYAIIVAYAAWFSLTMVSPVGNYINRRFMEWVSARILWREFARYSVVLAGITLASAVVSMGVLALGLLGISINWVALLLCVSGLVAFTTVNGTIVASLNLLGHRLWYVVYANGTVWLGLGISLILTSRVQRCAEAWIAGQMLGMAVMSLLSWETLRRSVVSSQISVKAETNQQGLWSFAWPLVISASLYWFQVQGYRIELEHSLRTATVGLLVMGLTLGGNPIAMIDTLVGEYLRPFYYRRITGASKEAQEAAWSDTAYAFLATVVPAGVLVALSGRFLAQLLVGPAFRDAANVVFWGSLLETLRAVNSMYVLAAHAAFRTRAMVWPSALGALLLLATVVPLAHWNLYAGVGISLTAGMLLGTAALAWQLWPHFRTRLSGKDLLRIVVGVVPLVLILSIAQHLVPNPSAWQALLVLAGCGLGTLAIAAYLLGRQLPLLAASR